MQKTDEIKEYAESVLSKKRFAHTVSVAEEAKRLALIWGEDSQKAYIAGLAHDIAKEIPARVALEMLENFGYEIDEAEKLNTALLHGPLAAFVAEKKFGITDSDILNAISNHTTGRPDMSLLEKIVFVADFAEPLRTYPEAARIRELAEKNLDEAVLAQADYVIKFIIDCNRTLHISTVDTRNYYLMKIKRG